MNSSLIYHNSRDPFYRFPQGARACGEMVRLRIRAPQDAVCRLRLWENSQFVPVPMRKTRPENGFAFFETSILLPPEPDVLWYAFLVQHNGRDIWYGNAGDGLGGVGKQYEWEGNSFQITVYDEGFETPTWMHDAVMYQIFPDRFCKGGEAQLPTRANIRLHEDWNERPFPIMETDSWGDYPYDFFGGNLQGIIDKLDYLQGLGVTVLYLNPVFRAASNHKYDTGDYHQIDPSFGTNEDFARLCAAARERGMRVMLDGVFSHTGDDSAYFNRYGHYDSLGAYQSKGSPFASWYQFEHFPNKYKSWWGVETLPELNKNDESLRAFFLTDENAVVKTWLRHGASGWRLDVADELPDDFLQELRRQVKATDPQAAVLGEVWEDASNKISYGKLRAFASGRSLDSVMNYPLREALLQFFLGQIDAETLSRRILSLKENYPPQMFYALMNLIGSHDRVRSINILGGNEGKGYSPEELRQLELTPAQYAQGKRALLAMFALVCALPGMPTIYYGDEAGVQGGKDPYCRGTYPWGNEDHELLEGFRASIQMRKQTKVWSEGDIDFVCPHADVVGVRRWIAGGRTPLGQRRDDGSALFLLSRAKQPLCVQVDGQSHRLLPYTPLWLVSER